MSLITALFGFKNIRLNTEAKATSFFLLSLPASRDFSYSCGKMGVGVMRDEFIEACRAHQEIHTREKRSGFCQWNLVLTLGAYT